MWSVPSAGPRNRVAGMPTLRVAPDHRDVGHQRQLEATAEREAVDLGDDDLRVAEEVVVEAERLAIDRESPALARPPWPGCVLAFGAGRAVAVPGVGVAHVGAGAEHAALAPQQHDLHVVVERDVVQVATRAARAWPGRRSSAARGCSG